MRAAGWCPPSPAEDRYPIGPRSLRQRSAGFRRYGAAMVDKPATTRQAATFDTAKEIGDKVRVQEITSKPRAVLG